MTNDTDRVMYGLQLIVAEDCDEVAAAYYAKQAASRIEALEAEAARKSAAIEAAIQALEGIPAPRLHDGYVIYFVSDDVPEDIFVALEHLRATRSQPVEGEG